MPAIQIFESTKERLAKCPKGFKLPKTLAECGDLAYALRQQRYDLNKQVADIEAQEAALADHLIQNLPVSEATGVRGRVAQAKIEKKEVVQVTDWNAVQAYILKNAKKNPGVWSLFQRRIGEATVKEMWARNENMPGCEKLEVKKISLTKI